MAYFFAAIDNLSEESHFAWLRELKRITGKGAILLISVQGPAQMGLGHMPTPTVRELEEKGFLAQGRNVQLDEVMGNNDHYINAIQSRAYIRERWSQYFTIVDIVDAIAANQDLVVMRKD